MIKFMAIFAIFAVLIILAVVLSSRSKLGGTSRDEHTFKKKALLTNNEKEFFKRICAAAPEFHVFAQVSMGALMDGRHISGSHMKTRAKFAQKIVDFVISDKDGEALLLIELDDRMHDSDKDKQRDKMTSSAGYTTLRFDSRNKPDIKTLRAEILKSVKKGK